MNLKNGAIRIDSPLKQVRRDSYKEQPHIEIVENGLIEFECHEGFKMKTTELRKIMLQSEIFKYKSVNNRSILVEKCLLKSKSANSKERKRRGERHKSVKKDDDEDDDDEKYEKDDDDEDEDDDDGDDENNALSKSRKHFLNAEESIDEFSDYYYDSSDDGKSSEEYGGVLDRYHECFKHCQPLKNDIYALNGVYVPLQESYSSGERITYLCNEGYIADLSDYIETRSVINKTNKSEINLALQSNRFSNAIMIECAANGTWHILRPDSALSKRSKDMSKDKSSAILLSSKHMTELPKCLKVQEMLALKKKNHPKLNVIDEEFSLWSAPTTSGSLSYADLNMRTLTLTFSIFMSLIFILIITLLIVKFYKKHSNVFNYSPNYYSPQLDPLLMAPNELTSNGGISGCFNNSLAHDLASNTHLSNSQPERNEHGRSQRQQQQTDAISNIAGVSLALGSIGSSTSLNQLTNNVSLIPGAPSQPQSLNDNQVEARRNNNIANDLYLPTYEEAMQQQNQHLINRQQISATSIGLFERRSIRADAFQMARSMPMQSGSVTSNNSLSNQNFKNSVNENKPESTTHVTTSGRAVTVTRTSLQTNNTINHLETNEIVQQPYNENSFQQSKNERSSEQRTAVESIDSAKSTVNSHAMASASNQNSSDNLINSNPNNDNNYDTTRTVVAAASTIENYVDNSASNLINACAIDARSRSGSVRSNLTVRSVNASIRTNNSVLTTNSCVSSSKSRRHNHHHHHHHRSHKYANQHQLHKQNHQQKQTNSNINGDATSVNSEACTILTTATNSSCQSNQTNASKIALRGSSNAFDMCSSVSASSGIDLAMNNNPNPPNNQPNNQQFDNK
jgi:hypothetical protein